MKLIKNSVIKIAYLVLKFLNDMSSEYLKRKVIKDGWLEIGSNTYGCPIVHNYKGSEHRVIIGKYCSIGPDVHFITGGVHPIDWVALFPFRAQFHLPGEFFDGSPSSKGDIVVGNDVWFSTHIYVLSGVHIGHGAVIASGSVVTHDIPPFAIAGGVPAKVIKYRFDEVVIQDLLAIAWWDWSHEKIMQAVPLLSSIRFQEFIQIFGRQDECKVCK